MFKLALADDEGLILNSMASMIHWEKLGFTVKGCFTDGYDFIKAFERGEHYDAILTDIRMDGISGMDIAKYIYEKQLFIPIVFLSGYQEFEYAQMGMHYGVVEYLTKPCSIAKIEETMLKVANVLQNSVRSGNRVELMEETGRRIMQPTRIIRNCFPEYAHILRTTAVRFFYWKMLHVYFFCIPQS